MTQPGKKIYHYHLKKCGGTTLNSWLSLLTADDRTWESIYPQLVPGFMTPDLQARFEAVAKTASYLGDIIFDHAPIARHLDQNAFRFTLLRSPIPRLLSQIKDFRRLDLEHLKANDPMLAGTVALAQNTLLNQYLIDSINSPTGPLLNNYQVKALAASTLGLDAYTSTDMEYLLDVALKALHENFNFIGVAEQQDMCRNIIASQLGLPPIFDLANLNSTPPDAILGAELAEAAQTMEAFTRYDKALYAEANRLFNTYAGEKNSYLFEDFERLHAADLLSHMTGRARDGGVAFSVRDPLFGQGFHGRDAAKTPHCAVWAGPSTTMVLYMPVLPHTAVEVMLWVRGYADDTIGASLRIYIDGQEIRHQRLPAAGALEVLVVPFSTSRTFVRLEIKAAQTVATDGDARKRSFCFDSYGWRVV